MALKVLLLKGLPASGKSTFARQFLQDNPRYKRVNRDELRQMIDDGVWSQDKEKVIRQAELDLALLFVKWGFSIVVDDTNLSKSQIDMWQQFASDNGLELEEKFFDISVEEAIKRDLGRPDSVGESVIKRMWRDYFKQDIKPQYLPDKPYAIMCDLDGTLALFGNANPYERDFMKDAVSEPVADVLRMIRSSNTSSYSDDTRILLLSGRKDTSKKLTMRWLQNHDIPYDHLFMRKSDDNRKDFIIKEELYRSKIEGRYNIKYVIDDRPQVVRKWKSLGLFVFNVGDDIEF